MPLVDLSRYTLPELYGLYYNLSYDANHHRTRGRDWYKGEANRVLREIDHRRLDWKERT